MRKFRIVVIRSNITTWRLLLAYCRDVFESFKWGGARKKYIKCNMIYYVYVYKNRQHNELK